LSAFLEEEYLVKPNENLINNYNNTFDLLQKNIVTFRKEINGLKKLKEIVLTKISKVETLQAEAI
jgi:hypothetical protein